MESQILAQFLFGALFLIVFFINICLPGYFLIRLLKLKFEDSLENFCVSAVLGIVGFTLLAYLFAFLHIRFLMWLFPILGIFTVWKFRNSFKISNFKIKNWSLFLLIIILGVVAQVAVVAPSGLRYSDGLYFWSANGRDGVWHLALMEELKRMEFPFMNPILFGANLQNYHFLVDLFMSEMARLFRFSNSDIYFRFTPIVLSILLGVSSFILVRRWSGSRVAGYWAMFFTYFAGSFGYIVTGFRDNNFLGGETLFWSSQTPSVLGNPPQASAFVLLITFLFLLLVYLKENGWKILVPLVFIGGAIIEFKVYGGILVLGSLLVIGVYEFIKDRKFRLLKVFGPSLLLSLLVYLPNSKNSAGFLIFEPWWYVRTMVVASERLNMIDLERRRQFYLERGNITAWMRIMQYEGMAFAMFLFGNLGTKFIGLWDFVSNIKGLFKDYFRLVLYSMILGAFIFPMLFLQKGVAYNTIQFMQYFLLLFGFITAVSLGKLQDKIKNKLLKLGLIILVVIFSVPTHVGLLKQFYQNQPPARIDYHELEGLNELNKLTTPGSRILTGPFFQYVNQRYEQPVPIHTWSETSYVSAFSGRRTVIADVEQLNILGYDISKFSEDRTRVFGYPDPTVKREPDPLIANRFFEENKIDFVYLTWEQEFAAPIDKLNLDLVYQNKVVKIYKVRKV